MKRLTVILLLLLSVTALLFALTALFFALTAYAGDVIELDPYTGKVVRSICPSGTVLDGPWKLETVFPRAALDLFQLYSCGIEVGRDPLSTERYIPNIVLIYAWDIKEKRAELIKAYTINDFHNVLEMERQHQAEREGK